MLLPALTALAEVVFAIGFAIAAYPRWAAGVAGYDAARGQLDLAGHFVLGATMYLGFLLSWRGLLCLVLFGEGLVRLLGVAAGIEVGTVGGWLARRARASLRPRSDEIAPPDVIALHGDQLVVDSANERLVEPTNVVEHEGRDFICEEVQPGRTPRPYRYVFRPLRDADVVRKRVALK